MSKYSQGRAVFDYPLCINMIHVQQMFSLLSILMPRSLTVLVPSIISLPKLTEQFDYFIV